MGRRASLAACRSTVTHVAAICNKKTFQEILPQVVLVGENQVTEARLATLRSAAPERCHIWRYKTGWMTAAIMVEYVRLLGRSLKDFQSSHRFILYFDALRAHIHPNVLRAASRAGLWVCVIPGKLTWAPQPCDTHLFASYKRIRSGSPAQEWHDCSWGTQLGAGVGSCVAYCESTHRCQRLVSFLFGGGYRRCTRKNISTDERKAASGAYRLGSREISSDAL